MEGKEGKDDIDRTGVKNRNPQHSARMTHAQRERRAGRVWFWLPLARVVCSMRAAIGTTIKQCLKRSHHTLKIAQFTCICRHPFFAIYFAVWSTQATYSPPTMAGMDCRPSPAA
ncbi:hypothetical protein HUK68_09370 [Comamonas antarctica]|uniref:Uncharacterized protein n=1 Tax=Comamonas antarctica TaxID=2743470 RepID=A0A6N1WWI0_9BURK|nr:hypothetical protein HUK68_09370 [Comamonas antarctica]